MLLRFGVENHLSIRGLQELFFVASSLKDPGEGLIPCPAAPSGSVLPATVIYGANASGKSNLMDAMRAMRAMVAFSHTKGEPGGGVPRQPFRLDPACAGEPSHFEIDFVLDGVRHHYGFEASNDAFVSEWLYAFPKSHRRMLFEREGSEFHFGRSLKGRTGVIKDLTRPNSLYLSAAAQNGHEQLSPVFEYFRTIERINGISIHGEIASLRLADKKLDSRVVEFLEKIGTGVVGYRHKEREIPEGIRAIQQEIATGAQKRRGSTGIEISTDATKITIELAHRDRNGNDVYFGLNLESAGTRRLLIVLDLVFRALDRGTSLFIDELDASLHTQAAEEVLGLFCLPETNPKGAQLVATTHDTNLMRSPVLRRDQLWFIEKDRTGATRLYPLTDIRTRKGDNIEKGYLQGRFGATLFEHPVSTFVTPH